MKKAILILLAFIPCAIFAQTKANPTIDKVKAGVKKYLYLNMKDYRSYQSVQWGNLEIIYYDYFNTDRCKELLDSIKTIQEPFELDYAELEARSKIEGLNLKTDSVYKSHFAIINPVQTRINKILDVINIEKKAFKKRVIGYSIYHRYRGKNSYGAYIIDSDTFTLDKTFKVESTASEEEDN